MSRGMLRAMMMGGLVTVLSVAGAAEPSDKERIEALEKKIEELEALVRGQACPDQPRPPAAPVQAPPPDVEKRLATLEEKSRKYDEHALAFDKIHLHGYGEFKYNNPPSPDDSLVMTHKGNPAQTQVHRLVLGAAYDFTDTVRSDFEVEWEHGGKEIEVEYGFLEMDLTPGLSFRAGSLLMPVGPFNEFHEPINFYSVERPYLETFLIPTTWQEVGAGLVGRSDDGKHAFRTYLTTGMDATKFTALGFRGGSAAGKQGSAADLALAGRYETSALPVPGFKLGASGYWGEADQENAAFENVTVGIGELDARYRRSNLEFMATGVMTSLTNADQVSLNNGQTVGSRMMGWNAELAYHITAFEDKARETDKEFVPFLRYEKFDTQAAVAPGFINGREFDRQVVTTGLAFFPTKSRNVVIKGDIEFWRDGTNKDMQRFNMGVGYAF